MTTESALALVRRTRRRLEAVRLLRMAARGAIVLAATAIVLVLLGKSSGVALDWTWWLPVAGATAGLVYACTRQSVAPSSAALYLDARSETEERFTTLWSNPQSERADLWADEIGALRAVPALTWPREAGLVPVALFLLFAASLLPANRDDSDAFVVADVSPDSAPEEPSRETRDAESGDPDKAAKRLGDRRPLQPTERRAIDEAIERAFARPEERLRARAELAKATGGDAASAERLADALVKGAGALGGEPSLSRPETPPDDAANEGARRNSPYPEEYEYLRAYSIELARMQRKEKDR